MVVVRDHHTTVRKRPLPFLGPLDMVAAQQWGAYSGCGAIGTLYTLSYLSALEAAGVPPPADLLDAYLREEAILVGDGQLQVVVVEVGMLN